MHNNLKEKTNMYFFNRIKLFFVFIEFVCYSIVCTNAACDTKIISTYTGDVVLSASSEYASRVSSQDHSASRGILNFTEYSAPDGKVYHGAWTAAKNDKLQYIQIQLKRDYNITGVITQGRDGCCPQWVTQYRILYGNDCTHLKVLDSGNGTEFSGNADQDTMVTNMFKFPVAAKCIHIAPTDFYGQISMRVEILGCPLMTTVSPSTTASLKTTASPPSTSGSVYVGMTTPAQQKSFLPGACSTNLMTTKSNLTTTVTSSSIKDKGSVLVSYQPDRAILNSQEETNKTTIRYMGGWSPAISDTKQYIQVEFSDPTIIRGLVTQGKNGCCNKWVTKYKISYSTDCKTWNVSGGNSGQIFKANTDRDTPVTNILLCPTAVKCLRIQPEEWNNAIGMRFELIGCQIQNGGISASNVSSATTLANQVTVQSTSPSTVSSQATSLAVNSVSVNQQPLSGQHCNSSLFSNMPYRGNITMTSSSELMKADKTNDFSADRGRLHAKETMTIGVTLHGGWSAAVQDTNQFIKVQLPSLSTITGVVTQGKDGPGKEWTTKYRVLYSADCKRYNVIHPVGGGNFVGNTDENTEVTNMFSRPVEALCVQINPIASHNRISMRMDLIGCYRVSMQQSSASTAPTIPKLQLTSTQTPTTTPIKTTMPLVKPTQGQLCHNSLINNATLGSHVNLTASSTFHNPTTGTTPSRAVLDTKTENLQQYGTMLGGWTPAHDGKQYIQATFSKPQMIDKIVTQGVDNMQQWVTKFSIQYSQDCVNWQQLQNPKEFIANTDDKTKVTNKFGCPVFAKCVRVYPSDWHNHSGLRFDLIGCEIIDGPHPNVTLQKTTPGSSASMSTSSRSTLTATSTSKRPNITTAGTTLTSTKTTIKTTTTSPSTTPNPKSTQSTTTKPTTLLPVTHKIFPTGQASNYNTRDPLDCKRALLVDPCTNPIVKKHCFYSCNPKQGNNVLSSTNTIPFRQTTTITSKQTTITPVAVSNVQTSHTSSVSTHMSAAHINVSPSQSNMRSLHSNTMYNSLSTIQSTPTSMLPSSISMGVTSLTHSNILQTSMTTQNTIKSSSISPIPTAIASMSVTPTNAVSLSATHNVLPTGQASIYNSLDPIDCKRSLLMFSCSMPIIAKHCHYSCSNPSSKLLSSSMFHSSVSVVAHSQNSDKTSIISQTSFLNGIQSTQLSKTQINPSKPITNLFTTMNQNSNQLHPSSLTSAMFSVTSMVNPSSRVHSNSAIISSSINSNPSSIIFRSTTPHTSTAQSSNSNMAQMSRYSQASGSVTKSMVQSSIQSKPLSVTGLTGIQTTILQSALKDSSVTSAMMTASMPKGSSITQYSTSLSSLPLSAVLQNVQSSDKPSSTVVYPSSVFHQHYLNSLNSNPPSSIIKTTLISSLPSSGVPSSVMYQSAFKTGSYSSLPQSILTSSMHASSVTSLTSPMQASRVTSLTSSMQASRVNSLTSPVQASSVTSLTSSMQASSVTSLTSPMQASSVHSLTPSMQASSVTNLTLSMQASSVTSLSSGVTGLFTSSVSKGSGNFVSSFSSVGITSSNTIGSSSLQGKGNPAISTYASSGQYTSVVSAINSLLPVQSSNILRSQFVTNSFLQSSVSSPSITASVSLSQLTPSIVQSSPPLSSVRLLSTVPLLQSSIFHSGYQSSLGHLSSFQSLSVLNPGMTSILSSLNTNKIQVTLSQNQGLTSVPSSLNQDSSIFQIPTKSSIFASLNPSAPPGLSSQISDSSVLFSSPNHALSSAISSVHPIMLSVPSSLNTDMVSSSSNLIMSSAISNINPSMTSAPSSIIQSMTAASSTLNQGRIFIPSSLNPSMSSSLLNINSGMASASLSLKSRGISTPLSTSPIISFAQSSQSPLISSAFLNINPSKLSTQFSISPSMSYTTSIKNSVKSLSTSIINTVSLSSSIPTASLSSSIPTASLSSSIPTASLSSSIPTASLSSSIPTASLLSSNGPRTMSIISSSAYQSVAMLSMNTPVGSYSASMSTSANSVMISLNVHALASSKSLTTSLSTSVPSLIDSVSSIDSSTQLPSSLLVSSEISTSPFWSSMQSVQSSVPLTSFGDVSSSYETSVSFIGYQATAMPFLSTSMSLNSKQMSLTFVPLSSELSLTISDSSNIPLFSMSSSIIVSSGEHSSDLISASDISLSHGYSPLSSAFVSMTCYNIPVMYSNAMSSALQSVTPTLPSVQTLQTKKAFGSSVLPTNLPISHTISHSMPQPSVSILQTSTQTSKITTPASKQLPTTKHVTNVILPTGVASIYNNLDPLDCKRSLKMFSCSMSIVAKHCFYSCRNQNSTTVHPISPGKLSLPTGSSTMAKSKIIFQSLTATFSKAMSNFSTSKKPNLTKFTISKSKQKLTSTTKPLTSMQTTKPSTISSTTKPSTISSTTKPLIFMSTPSSTTKTTTQHINHTVKSLYDSRDPQNCKQLITWIQCTDFYYGNKCKFSCVNKHNAVG